MPPEVPPGGAQHQPLIPTMPRVFQHLFITNTVRDGALFLVDLDLLKDIVAPKVELRDALVPAYCKKGL